MSLFIINTIIFYIFYWLYRAFTTDDIVLKMYEVEFGMSDENHVEFIKSIDNEILRSEISGIKDKGFDKFQELLKSMDENSKKHTKMDIDENYRKKIISERMSFIRVSYATRMAKIAFKTFFKELWVLIPAVVLIVTGSLFIALVTSIMFMTMYSIRREYELQENIIYFEGEDSLNDVSIRISIFIMVVIEAIFRQSYFLTYFLFLNMFK